MQIKFWNILMIVALVAGAAFVTPAQSVKAASSLATGSPSMIESPFAFFDPTVLAADTTPQEPVVHPRPQTPGLEKLGPGGPLAAWVDDDWQGLSDGESVDVGGGNMHVIGTDAFATIQEAINAVEVGGTVNVLAGTYAENLYIENSLTLLGPNAAINPNSGVRGAEAILHPETSEVDPYGACNQMAYLIEDSVTIRGFTFDGDNPDLTSGIMIGSSDVDACELIASYEGVGNIVIENNILKNATYTALEFYNYTNSAATAGNFIRYNQFENIGETTYNWGIGVLVYNNFYADVTDNVFNEVRTGIQTGNFFNANPGTTGRIANNTINAWRVGIFHNLWYSNASSISVDHNSITAIPHAGVTRWTGMLLTSFQQTATTSVMDNTILVPATVSFDEPGYSAGYNLWNLPTSSPFIIQGGTVSGADIGVWINNYEGYNSNAANTSAIVNGMVITEAKAGIMVWDSPSNTNGSSVSANILNNTIRGSELGLVVGGEQAVANATANFIEDGVNGVLVQTDALLTLHENRLAGNTEDAIINLGTRLVDASANYLGSTDADVLADAMMGPVDYTPWLHSPLDLASLTPGFQPGFSILYVDDDSAQAGSESRIHEGIRLVTTGGTVTVWDGTYYGAVVIDKPLTLQSENGPEVTTLHGGLTAPTIYVVSIRASDVDVDGFTVTNPLYNERGGDVAGIVAAYYGDPLITNVGIRNNIVTQIGADTRLLTDPALHWTATGIVSAGYVDGLSIEDNTIYNIHHTNAGGSGNNLSPVAIGVFGEDDTKFTTNVQVTGNTIYDISAINTEGATGNGFGIAIGWASGKTDVEDNLIYNVAGRGISTSLYTYDEVQIVRNTLHDIGQTAIMFRSLYGGTILENNIYNNVAGITLGSTVTPVPEVEFNRIFGNGTGIVNLSAASLVAENNWFGCNEGPGEPGCDAVSGLVDANPWLVLTVEANPASIYPGLTSAVDASLVINSAAVDTSAGGTVPDGILAAFSAPDGGTVLPLTDTTLAGVASTVFTAPLVVDIFQVCAAVDNEQLCTDISVLNVAPVAVADSYTTAEDTTLTVAAPGVLANDTDLEPLTAALVTPPAHGTLELNADGSFSYIPGLNYNGLDTFTYKANDGELDSAEATVTITITPVNDGPEAVDDAYTVMENGSLTVDAAAGVLANDVEVDGDNVAVSLVMATTHGTLSLRADGSFTYTPNPGFYGEDSFVYQLTTYPAPRAPWTDEAVVTITVTPLFHMWMPIITR